MKTTELYEAFVDSQIALKEAKEQLKALREERQKTGEAARWATNGGLQARLDAFKAAVQPYEEKITQAEALVANLQAQSDGDWEAYEAERMKPTPEKGNNDMIGIDWETNAMPAHSFVYGHRQCMENVDFPNQEIRELDKKINPLTRCYVCGYGWLPSTDHTTPVLVYNQNHLNTKRTYSQLMTAWEMDGWRGLTTSEGKVAQGWGAPVEMGCFLVSLVTIQCLDKRTVAYLAIQFKDGDFFDLAWLDAYSRCILCNQPGAGTLNSKTLVCSQCLQINRHEGACLEAMRSQVIAQRLFLARWPSACLHCHVTGVVVGVPTQSEPGDEEDCPHCRKLGQCPRCGQPYGDDNQCQRCGFDTGRESDAMPIISTWCPCPNAYYSIEP